MTADPQADPLAGPLLNVDALAAAVAEPDPSTLLDVRTPAAANLTAEGSWRTSEQIRAGVAELGVADATPVGAYCGSGVTAAHTVLALHRAGRADAARYVGSWSHWLTVTNRPIATGNRE